MSKHGRCVVDWGDGTYAFRLSLGGIEEVEETCDRSIFEIAAALMSRTARLKWISEVLRVGLIGGGMTPVDALAKVRGYCDERPVDESRDVAYAVVLAGLSRVHEDEIERLEDDVAGKAEAPKRRRRKGSTLGPSGAAQQ